MPIKICKSGMNAFKKKLHPFPRQDDHLCFYYVLYGSIAHYIHCFRTWFIYIRAIMRTILSHFALGFISKHRTMFARILFSAALVATILSPCCQSASAEESPSAMLPKPVCFYKDQVCCYNYTKCGKVETKIAKSISCERKKCDKMCRVLSGGTGEKTCVFKNCRDVPAICPGFEFRAYTKFCPHLHCEQHQVISGKETPPGDILGKTGNLTNIQDFKK